MAIETRYQAIKRLEYNITYLMKLGLVPVTIQNWLRIYEVFKEEYKPELSYAEAYSRTSIITNVSDKTVKRVVKFMNEEYHKPH